MNTAIASTDNGLNTKIETTNTAWNDLPWNKIHRKVFKLQKAIYQAEISGNKAKAHKLQRLLHKSYYARLLAVRKVSQDNQGKKTAGIDGVKSIPPSKRFNLTKKLRNPDKAKSLRRVLIPKPGKEEKRPLGIPTIHDRALQALVKLSLEPFWEARFEEESYGFRPGRSTHDAVDAIFKKALKVPQYILDADISKCFDKINHDYLLSKLDCPTVLKRFIKQWLKAGVLDNGIFEETNAGTPQGGVISPLLANISLHGMINSVINAFPKNKRLPNGKYNQAYRPKIIRYADDFVVMASDPEVILKAQDLIRDWLKPVGLELSPSKTRLCNTLHQWNGEQPGFDFLGYNIRHYECSIHKGVNAGQGGGKKLYQLYIKPSKKAIKCHYDKCKKIIKSHRTAPQQALIKHLNPVISGWCNYYANSVSKKTFSKLDNMIWSALRAWVVSRCGKASYDKLKNYYEFGVYGHWTFQTKEGAFLYKHRATKIKRHIKVRGDYSPFNGDWAYWSKRMSSGYGGIPTNISNLLKKQKGRCPHCGQFFTSEDVMEIDHIIPQSLGGSNKYDNLQLLHRHCHDIKTKTDGSLER